MSSKNENNRIRTGSLALRIALGNALRLVLFFVIADLIALFVLTGRAAGWQMPHDAAAMDTLRQGLGMQLADMRVSILFKAEGVMVLLSLVFDLFRIRNVLRPIDELAAAAETLSRIDLEHDERFQRFEDALDSFSPGAEGAVLSTGEKELEGLEQAVNQLIERMREQNRQQARFVSDASHELRTPIAVIRGYADMLDRWGKEDPTVLEESISAIKTESESMQHLVEQLLFLARGDSGRTPVEMADVDLSRLMREVCEESSMIDEKHSYRLVEPAAGGGSAAVPARGDASLLKQTARILVQNASKYSPEGSEIRIGANIQNGRPCFFVQDEGIGMDSETTSHIFERFYRADDSRNKSTGGSGLGLAIAKWIVDRHGARFDVVSSKGVGTRIAVIL